jgi:hypothetical protein
LPPNAAAAINPEAFSRRNREQMKKGLSHGLINYDDRDFALYLRRSFVGVGAGVSLRPPPINNIGLPLFTNGAIA